MTRKKIRSETDQRQFLMVYIDFLESDLLKTPLQKLLFIYLKRYADCNNQCFPSIKTLAKQTKTSISKVKSTLKELQELGVLEILNRTRPDGGKTSNLYILHDSKDLWNTMDNTDATTVIDQDLVTRKKELVDVPAKAHSQAQTDMNNNISKSYESQVNVERFSMESIQEFFEYSVMIHDFPYRKKVIDATLNIIYDTLNTTKPTVRISGEDKPTMVVISKLMKLDKDTILYSIDKYSRQTELIRNPKAYMLSILYTAPEQMVLDIRNQVSFNDLN